MKTKKISELTLMGEMTDDTNIVVEEKGETKRLTASIVGKVKSVNGVQPDENGNVALGDIATKAYVDTVIGGIENGTY